MKLLKDELSDGITGDVTVDLCDNVQVQIQECLMTPLIISVHNGVWVKTLSAITNH